jgi:hypothetical protein
VNAGLNEFYKKGCQEKKLRLDRRREDFVSRSSPLSVRVPRSSLERFLLWLVYHPCGVHLPMVTTPIESGKVSKRVLVSLVSSMVLSEARGLSLFLVIGGGIA